MMKRYISDQKLKNIVDYAYNNVPYYKDVIKPDNYKKFMENGNINYLPIMTRSDVSHNYEKMFSDGVVHSNLVWESTSGTSGIPLKIGKSNFERSKMALRLIKWRRNNFGIGLADNYAYFITIDMDIKFIHSNNVFYFSEIHLDDKSLELYYQTMIENNITWIYCTPSVINVFKDFMVRNKLQPILSLMYIELTGEYLSLAEKKVLSDFFNCRVAVQYGITEVWSVAQECKCGKLHLMEEDIFLEIGKGVIYVTSLESFLMPFIRYEVDDELIFGEACSCCSAYRTIEILKSRTQEYLYLGKDIRLSPILLRISINDLVSKNQAIGISQYQFIQYDINSIYCYVSYSNESWTDKEISALLYHEINRLYELPTNFQINIEKVLDFRERMSHGKIGYFLSKIGRDI